MLAINNQRYCGNKIGKRNLHYWT